MGCGCNDKQTIRRMIGIGTNGNTSDQVFHPLVRVRPADTEGVRISFDLENPTGTVNVTRAVRTSNDGITWGAATTLGAATSSTGWSWGGAFDTPSVTAQYAEYGVVANGGSTSREQADLTAVIDIRKN